MEKALKAFAKDKFFEKMPTIFAEGTANV